MYRPFIFCCRTPVFLHYSTVYTIHFSLYVADSSHSMTYAGASQRCRRYQCFHSCSRIKSGMSLNKCPVQVCVCAGVYVPGCLALTSRFSPETHLSHSTEDGSAGCVFVSGALPLEHMVLDWCLCVSLHVSML